MNFIFVSLFENLIAPYFEDSILKRAVDKKIISTYFFNPRNFTANRYKKVDDYMIGGGAGLLLGTEPLAGTIEHVRAKFKNTKFLYLSPAGKKFKRRRELMLYLRALRGDR